MLALWRWSEELQMLDKPVIARTWEESEEK